MSSVTRVRDAYARNRDADRPEIRITLRDEADALAEAETIDARRNLIGTDLAELAADPIGGNSRMGRYTNFANLLDLCSLAVPAGTVNGLPFGVMLTADAFDDRAIAHVAELLLGASCTDDDRPGRAG